MAPIRAGVFGKRTPRLSKSARSGLTFPVSRVHRKLKAANAKMRLGNAAAVYATAVLEYLSAELLELAGEAAKDNKRKKINPRHVLLAVRHDQELSTLCEKVVFPGSGVRPHIQAELLAPKGKSRSNRASVAVQGRGKKKPASGRGGRKPPSGGRKKAGLSTLSERKLVKGQMVTVLAGDLVDVEADAIVHPTGSVPGLHGQVGSRMRAVGGAAFEAVVRRVAQGGPMGTNEARIGEGSKSFASNRVIHVNSPSYSNQSSVVNLTNAVENCFRVAEKEKLSSVAFPSVGSGGNNFPKQLAAETILRAISTYFKTVNRTSIRDVYFVLYDQESIKVYIAELKRLQE